MKNDPDADFSDIINSYSPWVIEALIKRLEKTMKDIREETNLALETFFKLHFEFLDSNFYTNELLQHLEKYNLEISEIENFC